MDAVINKPKKQSLQWLMIGIVITLAAFFFISSFIQLNHLQTVIHNNPKVNLNKAFTAVPSQSNNTPAQQAEVMRLQSLVELEKAALENQYHQVNMLLMSRIWISYIGFITGMIMCIVGVVFILGKLRIGYSEMSAKFSGNALSMKTASPGLLLCGIGAALMITTLVVNHTIKGSHNAIYLKDRTQFHPNVPATTDSTPPLPHPDSIYNQSP